jgi:hypothetical protein
MEIVQRAYDAHPEDRRLRVRYEDLLSDTAGSLQLIMDRFGLEIRERRLRKIVEAEDFENIPADRKGPDKPVRAASPGLWRENMRPGEQRVMAGIMNGKLRELGYETASSGKSMAPKVAGRTS